MKGLMFAGLIILVWISSLVLCGCTSTQHVLPAASGPTATPQQTAEMKSTPLLASATPVPSLVASLAPTASPVPTSTASPTKTPTITPQQPAVIRIENAGNLDSVEVWGRGAIEQRVLAAQGRVWIVRSPLGLYLYRTTDMQEIHFTSGVYLATESPDGLVVAAAGAGDGKTIQIIDLLSGESKAQLDYTDLVEIGIEANLPPAQRITALSFSQDGAYLYVGYDSATIVAWDVSTRSPVQVLRHPIVTAANQIVPSGDGQYLAVSSGANVLSVWSLSEGRLRWRTANGGFLTEFAFSPEGKFLITIGPGGQRLLHWNLNDGRFLMSIPGINLERFLGFTQDSKQIILITYRAQSGRYFLQTREIQTGKIKRQEELAANFALSPDGSKLVFQFDKTTLRTIILKNWESSDISINQTDLRELIFSAEGDFIAGLGKHTFSVWQLPQGDETIHAEYQHDVFALHFSYLQGFEILHNGNLFAWGISPPESLFGWNVQADEVKRYELPSEALNRAVGSPDGRFLAVCVDGQIFLYEQTTGQTSNLGRCKAPGLLAFAPQADKLAYASTVRIDLLEVPSGERNIYLTGNVLPIRQITYSPDGKLVASGTDPERGGAEAILWHLDQHLFPVRMPVPSYGVEALAFSGDGVYLATGGGDDKVRFWRTADGWLLRVQSIGTSASSFAFSPEGDLLAVGQVDGSFRLLQVPQADTVGVYGGHSGSIVDIKFSPDGLSLWTMSIDGTIRRWNALKTGG